MSLATFWFMAIAFLWLGYLFLEGFDFGVGMLLPLIGWDEAERRTLIGAIGPVWDGNEVWLIVAAGATFAAFPGWYASLFSGTYLVLALVLLGLIGRGVAFEFRGQVDSVRWRRVWDSAIVFGSWVPALGVGLLLTTTVLGLPLNARGDRVGSVLAALRWETALGALAVAGFALVHGAVFIALKTDGAVRVRARRLAVRLGPFALLPLAGLLLLVQLRTGSGWTWVPLALALVAAAVALWRVRVGHEGQAFALLGVAIAATVVTLFGALYPDVLPSTVDDRFSLTVAATSSSPYTLTVMSWVAAIALPGVLVYQGWTYWVFRKRLRTKQVSGVH
jgi:cytochrome d ubiquinol oxidase subunit II